MDDPRGLAAMLEAALTHKRSCSCHPDDAPSTCPRKYATGDCWRAAVFAETQDYIADLKSRDRNIVEQMFLEYAMRVRRALEQIV
jgi:hypothetical protein